MTFEDTPVVLVSQIRPIGARRKYTFVVCSAKRGEGAVAGKGEKAEGEGKKKKKRKATRYFGGEDQGISGTAVLGAKESDPHNRSWPITCTVSCRGESLSAASGDRCMGERGSGTKHWIATPVAGPVALIPILPNPIRWPRRGLRNAI